MSVTSSPEKSLPYLLFTTSKKTQGSAESFCFYLSLFRSIGGRGSHCETSLLLFHDMAWIPKTQHFCFSLAQRKAKICLAWDTWKVDLGSPKQISGADLNWEVDCIRRTYMQSKKGEGAHQCIISDCTASPDPSAPVKSTIQITLTDPSLFTEHFILEHASCESPWQLANSQQNIPCQMPIKLHITFLHQRGFISSL